MGRAKNNLVYLPISRSADLKQLVNMNYSEDDRTTFARPVFESLYSPEYLKNDLVQEVMKMVHASRSFLIKDNHTADLVARLPELELLDKYIENVRADNRLLIDEHPLFAKAEENEKIKWNTTQQNRSSLQNYMDGDVIYKSFVRICQECLYYGPEYISATCLAQYKAYAKERPGTALTRLEEEVSKTSLIIRENNMKVLLEQLGKTK